jgi:hypothetical protein
VVIDATVEFRTDSVIPAASDNTLPRRAPPNVAEQKSPRKMARDMQRST